MYLEMREKLLLEPAVCVSEHLGGESASIGKVLGGVWKWAAGCNLHHLDFNDGM